MDVVAVANRMGHSDASTTLRIYAHAFARRDYEAAQTFDRIFGGLQLPPRPQLKLPGQDPDHQPEK
jgi:hypothetical protein